MLLLNVVYRILDRILVWGFLVWFGLRGVLGIVHDIIYEKILSLQLPSVITDFKTMGT